MLRKLTRESRFFVWNIKGEPLLFLRDSKRSPDGARDGIWE